MTTTYDFKRMTVVPGSKDFIDIVLSKTQRKTPTVVHKGYHISRIRQFYMKKVKYTQKTINEKLSLILSEFPRVDDIHPFYGDLMHILYDRDHYKVALGQVSAVRHMVDNVGRDYVRLMKYGDSLYRCKQLKRAALGRMATACKKLGNALTYLEKVRQHVSRLPTIDPNTRTLLITGFPNVGKSSFLNTVTRADVDVQPYAFTTKSLFVGHSDYKYQPWQVIDTPGILDHSLDERNVIEMQAITALAHLRACILYFMDLSGQCGYSVKQQLSLFRSIKPLFAGKPIVVVFNKCDVATLDDLPDEEHAEVLETVAAAGAQHITTSTLTEVGIGDLKAMACEALLNQRAETKEGTGRFQNMQNRLYCAEPSARDNIVREPHIPESVLNAADDDDDDWEDEDAGAAGSFNGKKKAAPKGNRLWKTERDLEWENGGPGQYQPNHRKTWDLDDQDWVDDNVPEIMDGKNIADWVDPDIAERLIELEAEEERRLTRAEMEQQREVPAYDLSETSKDAVQFIRDRIKLLKMERALQDRKKRRTKEQQMAIDTFNARTGSQEPRRSRLGQKRLRSMTPAETAMSRERSGSAVSTKHTRLAAGRSQSRERSMSVKRGEGFRDVNQKLTAMKLHKVKTRSRDRQGKVGEADRMTPNLMPKHLFTGKVNTIGKRNRR